MSATTVAVNPVATPPPARPAADQASSAGDHRFDRHLDAARQQQGDSRDTSAHDDHHEAQAKPASEAAAANKPQAEAPAKEPVNPDAAALAAAMLALIGQAAPAKPLAQATAATHVQAKAVTGAQARATPAALVLLAGAAAAAEAAAAKPAVGVDTGALAPMLAKPAEQKDASVDAVQLAGLANTPLATPDNTSVAAAPAHSLDIASPVGTPAFNQELGQQIAWLGSQDVKQARIRLHPEDLGALDVKVSINHDRVDVSFAVQHPAAVHALQQTLPQLDSLLAHHGLALGQADVGQRQQQGEGARGGEAGSARGDTDIEPAAVVSTPVAALGMLDTFA
ncbi:MAG TPA: flagellar hook-length control protein FliK [Frateuria sp.]|uniref:flagellar hook-length control protein FliK n=1 Tax=Frateuria sp. TaxID=2211372 RepID=UPI002DE2D2DA|nr:flagellar hook-length control protein FliK [Frateuria sp.]